jgi:hypothetical protein
LSAAAAAAAAVEVVVVVAAAALRVNCTTLDKNKQLCIRNSI